VDQPDRVAHQHHKARQRDATEDKDPDHPLTLSAV
jgi:hypothetical protein